jgi:hypothetical protein
LGTSACSPGVSRINNRNSESWYSPVRSDPDQSVQIHTLDDHGLKDYLSAFTDKIIACSEGDDCEKTLADIVAGWDREFGNFEQLKVGAGELVRFA